MRCPPADCFDSGGGRPAARLRRRDQRAHAIRHSAERDRAILPRRATTGVLFRQTYFIGLLQGRNFGKLLVRVAS